MLSLSMFFALFVCLLLGFPVAYTLGGVAIVFGYIGMGSQLFDLLPLRIWGIMTNYVLLAVPLFVFMGVMLEKSGVAEELLDTMGLLFGKFRGGIALSVIVVGALLAASTGIVGATVVTMGLLSLPTMLKRGYSIPVATGTIAAAGTLGQIIPPSVALVLLGSMLNVPVGDMFVGALIPGMILIGAYLLWILILAFFKPLSLPAMPVEELKQFRESGFWRRVLHAFLAPMLLMLSVLGSIFFGIASPTEAAGVGALGALILTMLRKKFSLAVLKQVMDETTHLTSMVFSILLGATAFTLVFRGLGGDLQLSSWIVEADVSPGTLLAVSMLVMFIAGFFIDFIEIIFILVPVIAPLLHRMGVDLLWFGILAAVNLQTSFLTPPFGFALFYLKGVAPPEVKTKHIYKGVIPFVLLQLIVLVCLIKFPQLSLWLPAHFGD